MGLGPANPLPNPEAEVVIPITGANGRTADVITIWQFDRLPDGVRYSVAPRRVTLYIP